MSVEIDGEATNSDGKSDDATDVTETLFTAGGIGVYLYGITL